jgi:apoptosis-inducing factor 2
MKKVVVIGGGFAGSVIAKKLEREFNVTLIDTKPYFEFTPGILRTIAHPTRERCMQHDHHEYLHRTKVIIGKVREITENLVRIDTVTKIPYDYLVVATGSSYNEPFKHPQMLVASRAKELALHYHKLRKSKSVLIIGGGLVGVELAAEIEHYFPHLRVTIVHARDKLLERMPSQAQVYAHEYLERKGVNIIFGEKVVKHNNNVFWTDKGRSLESDIVFNCGGINPNSEAVNKKFKTKVDERGFVKVDEFLRLEGMNNIFIAGDVTNILEEKTAQNAEKHAALIIENIRATDSNRPLAAYQSKKRPIVISLGPYTGILVNNQFVMTGLIPAFLKWIVEKKEILKRKF